MRSSQPKRRKHHGTLVRELKLLYQTTHDRRLLAAVEALQELFPGTRRGPKPKWDEFRLMLLWIRVQSLIQSKKMTVSTACAYIAKSGEGFAVKNRSKGALERRYYEAVKHLKINPDIEPEWRREADNLAAFHAMKSKSNELQSIKSKL